MTVYELHDLLGEHRALIMNTWQFFVSVHLAMLGLAFVVRFYEPKWILRAMMLIAYLGFMYVNFNAQLDNYRFSAALLDYLDVLDSATAIAEERALRAVFSKGFVDYLPWIYGAASFLGLIAIFLPAFGHAKAADEESSSILG